MAEWCPPVAAEGRNAAKPCKGWAGCSRADADAWLATLELGRAWAIEAAQGPVTPAQGVALLQWVSRAGAVAGQYRADTGGAYLNPWVWGPTVQKMLLELGALCQLIETLAKQSAQVPPVPDAVEEYRAEVQEQKNRTAREWAVPVLAATATAAVIGLIVWRVTTPKTRRRR